MMSKMLDSLFLKGVTVIPYCEIYVSHLPFGALCPGAGHATAQWRLLRLGRLKENGQNLRIPAPA